MSPIVSGKPDLWVSVPNIESRVKSISSHVAPTIIENAKASTARTQTATTGGAPPVAIITRAMPTKDRTADEKRCKKTSHQMMVT